MCAVENSSSSIPTRACFYCFRYYSGQVPLVIIAQRLNLDKYTFVLDKHTRPVVVEMNEKERLCLSVPFNKQLTAHDVEGLL